MRLILLGSPPYATAVLAALLASPFRPVAIVTQPARAQGRGKKVAESAVAELARSAGVELLEPETVRDPAVLDKLRALAPDVFLVVSYGEILRAEFLAIPKVVSLNVHPSLLPRHRGATPVPAAILAGDTVTGVAIQKVAKELDAGDLLLVRETPIKAGETSGELLARLAAWSGELVLEALTLVDSGRAHYAPQEHALATYCKKLTKEHGRIDWSEPAVELERLVRAMNPWPGAATKLPNGTDLFVWRATVADGASAAPGTLLDTSKRLLVSTGARALELTEVQLPGKRPLPAADFLRGARLETGATLGAT
ncbi:MAG: methionyl-tRNA formyltransferase [Planctomycetes bacterium]|nr:methionyl-tRNA formyltransferase [Planctomycetota bacterium]